MRVLEIWTEELPRGWVWSPDDYVGGTHEFVVNTAKCADFEEVLVYYDGPPGEYDGIHYLPRSFYRGVDVVLCCNDVPENLGQYNIYWTNWEHEGQEKFLDFDERIVLSPYHQRIFGNKSRIVPHSCWPHEFENPHKIRKQCLYSSSPDRGGKFLIDIWPKVEELTGATIIHTYSRDISDEEMVQLYKESEFWLHPCQGVELFCIAAVKAQIAKCIPVVVPEMALETTVKYGVKTTIDKYLEDLVEAIENPPEVLPVDFGDWKQVTEELFKNVGKSNDKSICVCK